MRLANRPCNGPAVCGGRAFGFLMRGFAMLGFWSLVALCCDVVDAQQTPRPGGVHDDPVNAPRDVSGYSVRGPRIRIAHTTDRRHAGGSLYLQQVDPWLGYLWGRELLQREFSPAEGVFGEAGKPDGVLLPDGATHMMSRDHVNSCAACHNTPYRDAGAGMTIAKNGGTGRNTPHMFGAGLVEMLGAELRLAALRAADVDRNGWIDLLEMKDRQLIVEAVPGDASTVIDYGRFDDCNLDGRPDLNPVFHIVYVDGAGRRIAWARSLVDAEVKGYRLEAQVFGFGHRHVANRPPIATTLRAFTAGAFDVHQGLQAFDPTTLADQDGTGLAGISNAGAQQFLTAAGRDRGRVIGSQGLSLDDPDRDGVPHELSEGDLDVAEWYLLNHPRPARGRQTERTRRGEQLLAETGCTTCHVPNWRLPAADPTAADYTRRHAGDRRHFDVEVTYEESRRRLEGRLVSLSESCDGAMIPRRGEVRIDDLFSDMAYHDVGAEFYQVQFDGSLVRKFRTAPLWGVGSTAPYGHDGASLDLDSVIRRHGGEASRSREAYEALSDDDQEALQAFLRSLVLYQTDQLPCDINGDGRIDESFVVAGQVVGRETLRPEWLLRTPCRIEGEVENTLSERIRSGAVVNLRESYGLDLAWLRDADGDGWPDALAARDSEVARREVAK